MSYCRFGNTCGDLDDCVEALEGDGLPDSKRELRALKEMVALSQRLIDAVDMEELDEAIKNASD
jgi:hypothetical protein